MGSLLREECYSLRKSILHPGCVFELNATGRVEVGQRDDHQRGVSEPGEEYFLELDLVGGLCLLL